jgi:hypothetical protein
MVLGLSLHAFTQLHVAISLIGIGSGLVVLLGMLASLRVPALTLLFLVTTLLTSLTGFLFPFHGVTPGIVVGILSCIVLVPAFLARYAFSLRGAWRWVYVVTSAIALWFNVFVLIVQLFEKVPALHALAPTGSEPPFKITQLIALVVLAVLGFLAVRRFHPAAPDTPTTVA